MRTVFTRTTPFIRQSKSQGLWDVSILALQIKFASGLIDRNVRREITLIRYDPS